MQLLALVCVINFGVENDVLGVELMHKAVPVDGDLTTTYASAKLFQLPAAH